MLIKTTCKECGKIHYHNLRIVEHVITCNGETNNYIGAIHVKDSCTIDELVANIVHEISPYVVNGMTCDELEHILGECCGIMRGHEGDVVERIKCEMGLYCPDNMHLFQA